MLISETLSAWISYFLRFIFLSFEKSFEKVLFLWFIGLFFHVFRVFDFFQFPVGDFVYEIQMVFEFRNFSFVCMSK